MPIQHLVVLLGIPIAYPVSLAELNEFHALTIIASDLVRERFL